MLTLAERYVPTLCDPCPEELTEKQKEAWRRNKDQLTMRLFTYICRTDHGTFTWGPKQQATSQVALLPKFYYYKWGRCAKMTNEHINFLSTVDARSEYWMTPVMRARVQLLRKGEKVEGNTVFEKVRELTGDKKKKSGAASRRNKTKAGDADEPMEG